mmetsp:Transcript_19944/g.50456  ORF Transcript_19944/g.50456 Transcript_19944/m.50456 type:complete len:89 (-) Transcript_19944:41-307(-)
MPPSMALRPAAASSEGASSNGCLHLAGMKAAALEPLSKPGQRQQRPAVVKVAGRERRQRDTSASISGTCVLLISDTCPDHTPPSVGVE